jgi:thiamine-phosphate pyrophosphorylase
MADEITAPELCVLTGVGPAARDRLAAVLAAVEISSVFIEPGDAAATAPLVEIAQKAGAAAILVGDARLARTLRADGVHLPSAPTLEDDYATGREILGDGAIVGAEADGSRHTAMTMAEAGADYIAFAASGSDDAEDTCLEMVDWWAEVFEIPCVAYDVRDADMAAALALRGADFIGVRLAEGQSPADAADALRAIAAAIDAAAEVP